MCGLLLCPGPELRSRGEKVSRLWFIASRFLQSREWAAWRSRSWGVLKSGTRDSERKGGRTKKILYHHSLIEGLDTWFKAGFFLISVSSPKEPPKFKLAGLILHWLQNDRSFQLLSFDDFFGPLKFKLVKFDYIRTCHLYCWLWNTRPLLFFMSLSSCGTSHMQDWPHSGIAEAGGNVEKWELEG